MSSGEKAVWLRETTLAHTQEPTVLHEDNVRNAHTAPVLPQCTVSSAILSVPAHLINIMTKHTCLLSQMHLMVRTVCTITAGSPDHQIAVVTSDFHS